MLRCLIRFAMRWVGVGWGGVIPTQRLATLLDFPGYFYMNLMLWYTTWLSCVFLHELDAGKSWLAFGLTSLCPVQKRPPNVFEWQVDGLLWHQCRSLMDALKEKKAFWRAFTRRWSVVDCCLLVSDCCWLLLVGFLVVVGGWLLVVGCWWLLVVDCLLLFAFPLLRVAHLVLTVCFLCFCCPGFEAEKYSLVAGKSLLVGLSHFASKRKKNSWRGEKIICDGGKIPGNIKNRFRRGKYFFFNVLINPFQCEKYLLLKWKKQFRKRTVTTQTKKIPETGDTKSKRKKPRSG